MPRVTHTEALEIIAPDVITNSRQSNTPRLRSQIPRPASIPALGVSVNFSHRLLCPESVN
jgi:hypothetical protein